MTAQKAKGKENEGPKTKNEGPKGQYGNEGLKPKMKGNEGPKGQNGRK